MATLQCNYHQQEKLNKQVHTQTTIAHSVNIKVQGKDQCQDGQVFVKSIIQAVSTLRVLI